MKYNGSGLHWKRHCKDHGIENIETLWFKEFTDHAECTKIALLFSEQQDIVNSDLWLNLKPENGLDGCVKGTKFSTETKAKMSKWDRTPEICEKMSRSRKLNPLSFEQMSAKRKGKLSTAESRAKMSAAAKNRICSDETRLKLSQRVISAETRAKRSEALKKRHQLRKIQQINQTEIKDA